MGSTLDYHDWIELPADLDTDWHEQLRTNWEDIETRLLKTGKAIDRPTSAPDGALYLQTDSNKEKIQEYDDNSSTWVDLGDLAEVTPGDGLNSSEHDPKFDVSVSDFVGDGLADNGSNDIVPETVDEGTVTATGGADPAVDTRIRTSLSETDAYDFILYVDSDPSWNGSYAFNWDYGHIWGDGFNSVPEIDLTVNWDTDPGNGNDLTLRYEVILR